MGSIASVLTPGSNSDGLARPDGVAGGATADDLVRDSLQILALDLLPLKTRALLQARMVKTARLDCLIDLGPAPGAGGPIVSLDVVQEALGGRTPELSSDLNMLADVARLSSFDVYSLRIELRSLGVAISDKKRFTLSAKKKAELSGRMRDFIRPLLEKVFGDGASDLGDLDTLVGFVDRGQIVNNLQTLGDSLGLPLPKVLTFLDDYADIFTSVAYFRSCDDGVRGLMARFMSWLGEIEKQAEVDASSAEGVALTKTLGNVRKTLLELLMNLETCFTSLDVHAQRFWATLEAERFEDAFQMIEAHHTALGSILCGLAVKMLAWREAFPAADGVLMDRLNWIHRDLVPGLAPLRDRAALSMRMISG